MIILSLFSLILLGLVLIMGLGEQQPLHVLSIVDHTSWLAALVKDYSILRSALSPATLHFNYLVIESENFTASHFDRNLLQSLNVNRTIVVWKKPKALNVLRNERFEIDAIFARFYLPGLFPSLKRFLYLDNDVVVNVDVAEIITRPLYRYSEVPSVPHQPPVTQAVSTDGPRSQLSHSNAKAIRRKQGNAAVGMVYEMHPYYRSYMSTHFNTSHHLYRQVAAVLDKDAFLNAGVFVVDCDLWKVRNYTSIAEALILQNHQEHFYSTSVGDQGTFYLMLGDEVSFLPAQYNMRRFPKKTFHMLEQGFQGVVHFAGITKGDAFALCREPLKYPFLLNAALPLYLSAVKSFGKSLFKETQQELATLVSLCSASLDLVLTEVKKSNIIVAYNPGPGRFIWPPR